MRKFDIEAIGMRSNDTAYAGGFSLSVRKIIKELISGKVLHISCKGVCVPLSTF